MRYAAARSQIRSGDLLAFKGESLLGRLVCHVTGSDYSHVGIAWRFRGRLFILEAREGRGVGIRAASNALPFAWAKLDLAWTNEAEDFALSALGKPYSYLDALKAGLGFPLTETGLICSEYAATIQAHLDARFFDKGVRPTTPAALVNFWSDHGAALRTISN